MCQRISKFEFRNPKFRSSANHLNLKPPARLDDPSRRLPVYAKLEEPGAAEVSEEFIARGFGVVAKNALGRVLAKAHPRPCLEAFVGQFLSGNVRDDIPEAIYVNNTASNLSAGDNRGHWSVEPNRIGDLFPNHSPLNQLR